ncbi:MAG: radical SAM protein [Deltaproteobacteria bacterium]|nr:radical SAM protein [Deltaproteobacteria bacterium]
MSRASGPTADEALAALRRAGLRPPRRLTAAVECACNLSCDHCYVEGGTSAGASPPLDAVRRLLSEFAEVGGSEFCLTGGEPLLRPDWLEVVAFAGSLPGCEQVTLQTNATLLGPAEARGLAALRCPQLVVQVSLEGATAEAHDLVRGPGRFAAASRGLAALAEAGLAGQTAVAFTEMRHNLDQLPALFEWLERLGVGRVTSASVTPHGRASGSPRILPPEPHQYRELLMRYRDDAAFRRRCCERGQVTALQWWKGREFAGGSVCSLLQNPYLSTDGRLYPCPLLHAPEFAAEAAWDVPLATLLAQTAERWGELQRRSETRPEALTACRSCPGRGHCGGGCMGRAHMAEGTLLACEDRCGLRKAVYGFEGESPD